ncbi:histidine kinase [candidate division KSB1 bacterium]|nr:histidine kinase [candidate division KSB1 bacterium]
MPGSTLKLFTLLFALGAVENLKSQIAPPTFEHISLEHGLSQATVYAILQDGRGFMGFGTQDGLSRFDGYSFVVYRHSQTDSNSLPDNWIWCLYEDRFTPGVLWIGTQNGLSRFDGVTNRFTTFKHNSQDGNSLSHNYIKVIYQDRAGRLWIGTEGGGLNRLDFRTGHVKRYQHDPKNPNSLSHNRVTSIFEDDDGRLWIGTLGGGLDCLDPNTEKFTHYRADSKDANNLNSNHVMCLYADSTRRGILWIGTYGGGLNRFDLKSKMFSRFEHDPDNPNTLSDNRVFDICSEASGALWIGTFAGGLNRYDPEKNIFTRFQNDPRQAQSLSADFVRAVFLDQSGNLWIGTHLGGLNKFDLKPKKFWHYRHDPHRPQSLQNDFVNAIHESPEGALWIGTNTGLDKLEREGKAFQHLALLSPKTSNGKIYIAAIWQQDASTLWLGTLGEGLLKYQITTGAVKQFKHDPQDAAGLSDNRINALHQSRQGTLWLGTWRGLNAFDLATEAVASFQPDPQNPNSLSHQEVLCIREDRKGNLWVGTNGGGLNKFDPMTKRFTHFVHDPQHPHSLSHNIVTAIFEDINGSLWFGTSDGLNHFDAEREQFVHYLEADGLPNGKICGILGDSDGNLWISTWGGISRFNPTLRQFRNYDRADGLGGQSFRDGAAFHSPAGEIFFGGIHGLNRFHPQNVQDDQRPPRVVITSFKIFDMPAELDTAIAAIKTIKLSHRENFFSFEFAALDYTQPQKNRYAYKMEGFDKNWIQSGTRRYASYTNLDAGTYQFHVRGSNHDGVWNEQGAAVRLVITPPFWKTWWFRILATAAIIGLLALVYRYRVSQLLEVERLRVRIASDLHDDIGASLTKISLHSELVEESSEPNEIRDSLRKIGAMSRELVTTMSDIVWSIDARNDTVGDLVDRMRDFAAGVLSTKAVAVTFDLAGLEMQKKLPVHLRQNIYLIFKEAINNIAKHAAASRVEVQIKNAEGKFRMAVRDDGQGWHRNEYEKLTGHGLRNMKMRAVRIGGHLDISKNGGCTVSLTAPALR